MYIYVIVHLCVSIWMYVCISVYVSIYICLLIFVCMYVQVPKFHVRAFIFGVFVFIHLCFIILFNYMYLL